MILVNKYTSTCSNSHFQDTIDTYDLSTGTETINVTLLPNSIRHHSCVLIKGNQGHPTVAMCNDE